MPGAGSTQQLLQQITDPFGVYCLLEVRIADRESLYHVFPVMPESLAISQRYLSTVTPTQGGAFVDNYGRAPSPVLLQGTFGRSPRPAIALAQEAVAANFLRAEGVEDPGVTPPQEFGVGRVNGYKLMKLLGEMVERSHVPNASGELPLCIFYNFAFGAFYEVHLDSFDATMTMERNGLWVYRLQMTMLRRLNEGPYDSITPFVRGAQVTQAYDTLKALLDATTFPVTEIPPAEQGAAPGVRSPRLQAKFDALKANIQKFNEFTGYVHSLRGSDLLRMVSGQADQWLGLRPGTLGTFLNQVRDIPRMMGQVRGVITGARRLPRELGNELKALGASVAELSLVLSPRVNQPSLLGQAAETLGLWPQPRLRGALDNADAMASTPTLPLTRPDAAAAELLETVLAADEALGAITTLLATYDITSGAAASSSSVFAQPPDEGSTGRSRTYTTRQNDSLASIARDVYGDENRWVEVLEANRALFNGPNEITPTDTLNAFLGQSLVIPSTESLQTDLVPDVWDNPVGLRALGKDLPETLETRMRADGTKELVVLKPLETLLQGVVHRLQVRQGSLPDDPSFGSRIPTLIGETFGALDVPMNQARVAAALALEPRLAAVTRVDVGITQDTLRITFDAEAQNAGNLGVINLNVSRQTP